MISAPSVAIAIEGKYTATGMRLAVDQLQRLPYQLIHRIASACFPPALHRAVVYQIFDADLRAHYLEHLQTVRALLRAPSLTLALLVTPAQASDAYSHLLGRWRQGERKMAREVRAALLGDPAFSFMDSSLDLA